MKILTAIYRFFCPVCGTAIRKGETYVEKDDVRVCCQCGLPARRLRPLSKTA